MDIVILTTNTDPIRSTRYLGPYQIAWWLEKNGYSVQVLDFLYFMTSSQRMSLFKKYITKDTKIVGYAPFAMFGSHKDEIRFSKGEKIIFDIYNEIRENFPWVKIAIGGAWTSRILPIQGDAVFVGESEGSFLEYCNHIFKKDKHPSFTVSYGKKVFGPSGTYDIQNCDMSFRKNDFILPQESVPLELGRGCIFKCNFCQYPNIGKDKDDFNRSIVNIEKSLLKNYETFGTTRYHLADDTLNSHRQRTKDFYEITKRLPFKIEYIGHVRMDLLDIWPEQLDILPESGLISCQFGVESLDEYSCRQIGKGWGAKNHKKFLTKLSEHWGKEIVIYCTLIAGLGKEEEKDWNRTNDWFLESGIHDWWFSVLGFNETNPMSEFEKNPSVYGYTLSESGWKTDYTDSTKARSWQKTWIENFAKKRIPSAWNLVGLRNMGLTFEEIKSSNYQELNSYFRNNKLFEKKVELYYQTALMY